MSKYVRRIGGVNYINAQGLYESLGDVEAEGAMQKYMKNAGVVFFDDACTVVNQPMVGISAIGGLPIRFNDNTPEGKLEYGFGVVTPDEIFAELKLHRGISSALYKLNTGGKGMIELEELLTRLGHESKFRTTVLTTLMIGHSCTIEGNIGRLYQWCDHQAVIINGRTAVQDDPPVVAFTPEGFERALINARFRAQAREEIERRGLKRTGLKGIARDDFLEEINGERANNAATATQFEMHLKHLFATMRDLGDRAGQEIAWLLPLALLNDQLYQLFPERVQHSSRYPDFAIPEHWPAHEEWLAIKGELDREELRDRGSPRAR